MTETEFKVLLDEAGEARLRRRIRDLPPGTLRAMPRLVADTAPGRPAGDPPAKAAAIAKDGAPAADAARTARLLTRYFDTPDRALGRAGIALRLRREGRRWTLTVKTRKALRAGLSAAEEVDAPAPGGRVDLARLPDARLRGAIETLIADAELAPVFETDIQRTRVLLAPDGTGVVELAIDSGEVRAGEQVRALREAEFELLEGDPAALFAAARAVLPEGGLVFSTRSKAERGALLAATGRIEPEPEPRRAQRVAIDAGMSAESAGEEVLAECFEQITANIQAVLASDAPEGPHQLRIGLRRLRTALRLFRAPFDGHALRHLGAEARWFGQEVGRLRDLDVALADLVRAEAAHAPDEPGFAILDMALAARVAAERGRLRETLRGARVQRFLLDLAEFIALRGWLDPSDHGQTDRLARPVAELAAEMLDRALKRVSKRARGIDRLDVAARHELRKSLKSLRYAIEFFAPLWKRKRVKRFLKPLKPLQDLFGFVNDAAMAEALLAGPDAPAADDPVAARAAGRVIGARTARAEADWSHARARWRAVRRTTPFWR